MRETVPSLKSNHDIYGVAKLVGESLLYNSVAQLSTWNRLTGDEGAEAAAEYICKKLDEYQVAYEKHMVEMFVSNPLSGVLQVLSPFEFILQSKTRSFSASCPDGVVGELYVDTTVMDTAKEPTSENQDLSECRGRIVLSFLGTEDYVKRIEQLGAIGLIHIWPSNEDVIHEETVGPVWGNPTIQNVTTLPKIPVIGISNKSGTRLMEMARNTNVVVTVKTNLDVSVKRVSLPIATIPGLTQDYILLSSHYDSWHQGATDNAVGNALCLEIARLLRSHSPRPIRGLRIAWWPGHSNGRYAGSTWYCDRFWADLYSRCYAHVNVDSPGSRGGIKVIPRTAGLEDKQFIDEIVREFCGAEPECFKLPPRGADHSFWGVNIPIHLYLATEPEIDSTMAIAPGSGGGWWWHTEEDTLDKVDSSLLIRDTKIHLAVVLHLMTTDNLPTDFASFLKSAELFLVELDKNSDSEFNFDTIIQLLRDLARKIRRLEMSWDTFSSDERAKIVKNVGGTLTRVAFSSVSPYEHDTSYATLPFPGLQFVKGVYRRSTSELSFLLVTTHFHRQRNRLQHELEILTTFIDKKLSEAAEGKLKA